LYLLPLRLSMSLVSFAEKGWKTMLCYSVQTTNLDEKERNAEMRKRKCERSTERKECE
jgi:hypothetical protein